MAWVAVAGAVVGAGASYALNRGNNAAANRASGAAADAAGLTAQISADQYNDWKADFLPLQHDLVSEAKKSGSQYEYDRAAELANADVSQAYGRTKSDLSSRLASYGIDPSSGKYATSFGRLGLAEAAAGAGAMNKARDAVTDKSWAKKVDAYSVGKGIPGQAVAGLTAAAGANANIAAGFQNNASRNAAGVGSFIQQVTPAIRSWWNAPSAGSGAPAPGADLWVNGGYGG